MINRTNFLFSCFVVVCVVIYACKKKDPFPIVDNSLFSFDDSGLETLDPNSFEYIHKYVLKPTCANSGCHDGSFEPDYRTIYSAYNSLVYHPVISNDPGTTFVYRVLPGNADLSLLHERLTVFIPNTSGIMPLSIDLGSDWIAKRDQYIQNITNWINNGALDIFGNPPTVGNLQPQVTGMVAFPTGNTSTPYSRVMGSSSESAQIPQGATIDLWFSVSDDVTIPQNIINNKAKLSRKLYDYTAAEDHNLQIVSSITEDDFWGNSVAFTHRMTITVNDSVNSNLYLRTFLQDEHYPLPAENPSDGSTTQLLKHFSLTVVP